VNFDLTNEQTLLKDQVARFGREHCDFNAWRARIAKGHGFSRRLWAKMAELGWLGLTLRENDGGYGGGPVDTMVIMEGVGRWLMLEPYLASAVIAPVLLPHLADEDRLAHLERVMAGEAIVALADAEPQGRFDLTAIATRAAPCAGGYRLSGEKNHALDGYEADWFIIPARCYGAPGDEAGVSLFLVPRSAAGLSVRGLRAMDHRRNAALSLNDVLIDDGALIGPLGEGFDLLRRAVDAAIVARLAEALGAMDAAFEQTLVYLKTRQQFGQPIGGFQALQHRMVDMAIACEEARSMTYLATLSLGEPLPERRLAIAAAKARVGQTGLYVARQAVQLHGGMGFSDELAIGHYLKRLIMIDLAFGDAAHHRAAYAAARSA
jgi:alkylation response protein AidB-like acyl-CoA dehydrogenase